MTLPLRIILFYVNNFKKKLDLAQTPAPRLRAINRRELARLAPLLDAAPVAMQAVENGTFTARDGAEISFRRYVPSGATSSKSILFFHGGGFVTRDLDSHDKACRRIARETRLSVFSVGYRLAPEHKFPGPVYDCEDAYDWLVDQAGAYQLAPEKITVMGDSAGANLATVVCLLCKQKNKSMPWRQVLIYPTVDATMSYPSIEQLGKGYFLSKEEMAWFIGHYQRTQADQTDPLMSPIFADDLSGLPPAYLCTAEFDPLLDEGAAYAEKLRAAGVPVEYRKFRGVIHGFLNMRRLCRRQNQALHEDIAAFLR